jgi:AP-1 complex subunit gamma-1
MRHLVQFGFSPDYDVSGVTDPFLQIQLLTLLRVLARGDRESSDQINDILAQIAANTDVAKNSGTAVLYEAVRTIMDIEADPSLRVLAINTLGRFLVHQDNNVRYIALNLLNRAVQIDMAAVQRHRAIIVTCLADADISIRRRALELIYVLINESNVRVLVRELLVFLESADNELKPNLTMQICIAAEKFAPNRRWHFDTVLRVLRLAGAFVREQILSSFIFLVSSSSSPASPSSAAAELQTYMIRKSRSSTRPAGVSASMAIC